MALEKNVDRDLRDIIAKDIITKAVDAGDHAPAIGYLYEVYGGVIYGIIYRRVLDQELACDLRNEVFIKAQRALARYDEGKGKVITWLYKLALNVATDNFRKTSRRGKREDLEIETLGIQEIALGSTFRISESPSRAFERERLIMTVREAVNELSPMFREVIILRHYDDRGYSDIAKVLGIPEGTMKGRLYRAREALRKKLERRGINNA